MYYADLTISRYHSHSGPFNPANWRVPLLAVGWLEHPHEFTSGDVPHGFALILREMAESARTLYSHYYFRGVHTCSLCTATGGVSPGPIWSQENLFIPGRNVIYLSPGGIDHYVEVHLYSPPQDYVDAVLSCPQYGSSDYRDALCHANSGQSVPLLSKDEWRAREAILNALSAFGASLNDEEVVRRLIARGFFDPRMAERVTVFVPIAFGRVMLAQRGIQSFPTHFEVRARNGNWERIAYSSDAIYSAALEIAKSVSSPLSLPAFVSIATGSAEVQAADQLHYAADIQFTEARLLRLAAEDFKT